MLPDEDAARGTIVISVASCSQECWPHLVVGDPGSAFPSKAVAAYVRDGDRNRAITASEIHAWVVTGRLGGDHAAVPAIEQATLDRTLGALPRNVIRDWRDIEVLGGWRDSLSAAVGRYAALHNELEDRLADPELEQARRALHTAAIQLAEADAIDGFTHQYVDGYRNVGRTGGELEGEAPDTLQRYVNRAERISDARDALIDAHDALVAMARAKSFDLSALQPGNRG